ncbi:MAG: phosphatase PAP2 family protein [Phycisphaerales bacterium]|nr:phosphatase PAP2 family protein [Phycisphaerales bacterium]
MKPDRYYSSHERGVQRRRHLLRFAVFAAGLLLLTILDPALYHFFAVDQARIERRDWYRLLRIIGYLPTWILLSALLALGPAHALRGRAWLPAISAALAGLAAEILKLIIGRQRPLPDGSYAFKPFLSGFLDGSNLGMPSSHAAVAFGGAFALARLYPKAGPVALLCAAGCGLTRLLGADHFSTDVYVAAGLGYAVAGWLSGDRRA